MAFRKKINYKKSKKSFSRTASRTHKKNFRSSGSNSRGLARGGIRL